MLNLILSFHIKNFSVHSINHSDKSSLQPQSKHAHYVKSSLYPLIALSFSPAQAHALSQHARALSLSLSFYLILREKQNVQANQGKVAFPRRCSDQFSLAIGPTRILSGFPPFLKRREKKEVWHPSKESVWRIFRGEKGRTFHCFPLQVFPLFPV